MRFCFTGIDEGAIITKNEEIPNDKPKYTNQIPISTDTDNSIYNGKGWIENKRLNSTGDVADVGTYGYTGVTGFIPIANGDVIRTSANMVSVNGSEQQAVHFYKADKTFIARRRFIVSTGKFENNLYRAGRPERAQPKRRPAGHN